MLQPKRTKFRKQFKGSIKGLAKGGSDLNFGTYDDIAREALRLAAMKLPIKTRVVVREDW